MFTADPPPNPEPVPQIDASQFVAWLYGGGEARLSGAAYSVQPVPPAPELASLLDDLIEQGFRWMLADGPRRVRAHWILDPWWVEQPQMLPSLQKATQAGCVALADLRDALRAR